MAITHILHISDIHIGNGRSREAHEATIKEIQKALIDINVLAENLGVVLAGDIFDKKKTVGANDIALFSSLMETFAKHQVIIIPGNHDIELGVEGAQDSTSLIAPLAAYYSNVYYSHNTEQFMVGEVDFFHFSVTDPRYRSREHLADPAFLELVKDRVLLYHGFADGLQMGLHKKCKTPVSAVMIAAAKIVILGDIHGSQFIAPHCAYSGSPMQHKFDDTEEKGVLLWDLEVKKGQFIQIEHEYKLINVDLDDCKTEEDAEAKVADIAHHYPRANLRICGGFDIQRLRQKHPTITKYKPTAGFADEKMVIEPVNIEKHIRTLLQSITLTDEQFDEVLSLVETRVVADTHVQSRWTVLRMSWNNLFCYGPAESVIDFTKLDSSLSGIVAANHTGKSAIVDIMTYILFDKVVRGGGDTIIRTGQRDAFVSIQFQVDDTIYLLERQLVTMRNSTIRMSKQNGETWEPIAHTLDTIYNDKLPPLIGILEQFCSTAIFRGSHNARDLFSETGSDRSKIFAKILGFAPAEKIADLTKEYHTIYERENAKLPRGTQYNAEMILQLAKNELVVFEKHYAEIEIQVKTDEKLLRDRYCKSSDDQKTDLMFDQSCDSCAHNKNILGIVDAPKIEQEEITEYEKQLELKREEYNNYTRELVRKQMAVERAIIALDERKKYELLAPQCEHNEKIYKALKQLSDSSRLAVTIFSEYLKQITKLASNILNEAGLGFTIESYVKTSSRYPSIEFYRINHIGEKISILGSSGSEHFAISIALRLAFSTLLPSTGNFLIIDEGFGTLDARKKVSFVDMIKHFSKKYKFVLAITHIPDIQEELKHVLSINCVNKISTISNVDDEYRANSVPDLSTPISGALVSSASHKPRCEICNKDYATVKTLRAHTKKYHA